MKGCIVKGKYASLLFFPVDCYKKNQYYFWRAKPRIFSNGKSLLFFYVEMVYYAIMP